MEHFKSDTAVPPEDEGSFHFYDIWSQFGILQQCCLQDFNLDLRLSHKFLLSLDEFECNKLFFFMIERLEYFPKWTLSEHTNNLVSICNCIMNHHLWIAFPISEITFSVNPSRTNIIDLVCLNLLFLERSQFFLQLVLTPRFWLFILNGQLLTFRETEYFCVWSFWSGTFLSWFIVIASSFIIKFESDFGFGKPFVTFSTYLFIISLSCNYFFFSDHSVSLWYIPLQLRGFIFKKCFLVKASSKILQHIYIKYRPFMMVTVAFLSG